MKIKIGSNVPRRGTKITQIFALFILKLIGWKIEGEVPNLKKFIIIVAPHTSNFDFIIGLLVLFSLRLKINWMGKHTIFRHPFKFLMNWLGGIPINRKSPAGIVDKIVEFYDKSETLVITLAPEGTRKKVNKWKKGFYLIAKKANIPVVLGILDYQNKIAKIGKIVYLSDDYKKDFKLIKSYYSASMAKYPENF